ncbi:MAG: pyruvate dehydrogenase (acetyl-transferring) E1 component subunit alpha [Nitrospirae bacterium]|nr:pyruvate dehydrogenase (acetyl-transferring) E1 component subunit alpha [Nitrospirota bacterium]MBI3352024.1 pyruvate dehydrogenase (acetyl-transferring) E1 component subunit alpha [Nitrospirota bacterium]
MSPQEEKHLLSQMLLIRRFEEKAAEMYSLGKIGGFCHLYIGQEAVAVGAISALLPEDYVVSAYRDHGHCLAKGSDPKKVMAELFGRIDGLCKGKGGSMHFFDTATHFLGGYAIVGGHLPVATGVAFALKYQQKPQVVLCFFGEGAVNTGAFHESLNLASLWKLPVIYICENNRYGMGTPVERASSLYNISLRGSGYGLHLEQVDGMDVLQVRESVTRAVDRARNKQLPSFLEMRTYRYMGHSMSDPSHGHYRTKDEVEEQKKRDPIQQFFKKLSAEKVLDEQTFKKMDQKIQQEIEGVIAYADASPFPPLNTLTTDVTVEGTR